VHKLRNLERKAPKHAVAEIRADFHRIVYAELLTFFRFPKRQWKTLRTTDESVKRLCA
jgi:hypothetical protein